MSEGALERKRERETERQRERARERERDSDVHLRDEKLLQETSFS